MRKLLLSLVLTLLLTLLSLPALAQEEEEYVDDLTTWSMDEYEANGGTIESFQQSASLDAMADLPPVEERLPEHDDILVVQPRREVGTHGGELTWYGMNPDSFGNTGWSAWDQRLMALSTDWTTISPQIAKSVELSDDLMTMTITLRRGMKWSDGEPFTTADIMFWYEDIMSNAELPNFHSDFMAGGQPPVIEAVDDYTATFTFAQPYPVITALIAVSHFPMAPRHYLEQFHADYNENAQALAEEAGYETWADYFTFMSDGQIGDFQRNPDLPVLKPWTFESEDEFGNRFFTRNPYYYKVDTEGNQLPYVDSQVRLLLSDPEVIKLNIQAGEIDYTSAGFGFDIVDLPVLIAGEEQGDYTTLMWPIASGGNWKFMFNITTADDVLREIFNDVRWRQAMSLAINRAEINDTLFFNLGVERQWGPPQSDRFFEDWMLDYYADFDTDQANALLDEMGLEMGPDGYRLRPDGERLTVVLWNAITQDALVELVAEYWENVGVDVEINPSTREAFAQALLANEVHASVWFASWNDEFKLYQIPIWYRPPYGLDSTPIGGGLAWRQWYLTGGEQGEEPPEWQLEQMQLVERFQQTVRGTDEYFELGAQIQKRVIEQLYNIGTVGEAPRIAVRSNRLENFPDQMPFLDHLVSGHSDQWFIRE
ncbi:MAG: hypothetical protein CL610_25595 [Anaerolineaceae bacterium]|nr:hypothetical protein [Anaerolineaceae bacterium]